MKTLLTERQLGEGVQRLADEIDRCYRDRPLTVIAVMTGSLVLLADLIRKLSLPLRVGVVQASSYRDSTHAGQLVIDCSMLIDVHDQDVLIVDDIFDTGRTLERLSAELRQLGAATVRSAVLLQKQREHAVALRPDFVAFQIPDQFVVGYGLDYRDHFRHLPYLAILEPRDLASVPDLPAHRRPSTGGRVAFGSGD